MQFDSLTFLAFLVFVLAAAAAVRDWSARKSLLLLASYVFYGAWSPAFVLLLAGSSALDWIVARRIAAASDRSTRRRWLVLSLATNLGALALFKYGAFVHDNLAAALAPLGLELGPLQWSLVLPVGISFYTFQSLSYTLDVYRRRVVPIDSLRDFCLYVGFFPQLVAGPIVRFGDFEAQLREPRRPRWPQIGPGLALLLWGLFEKIVLADGLFAPVADASFSGTLPAGAAAAWVGVMAFSGQIFCDFAGYSCCAIGAARCLGFTLPDNFRNPYAARGLSDFWRRWHISLSTWLRDYLYIALGGNRDGRWRAYRNLMLTMLLGGLWHGAAWSFVLWGGLHGLYLWLERGLRELTGADAAGARGLAGLALSALTLALVMIAWVPFRADSLGHALDYLQRMFLPGSDGLSTDQQFALFGFTGVVLVQQLFRERPLQQTLARMPVAVLALLLAALLSAIVLSPGETHAFIYFQF